MKGGFWAIFGGSLALVACLAIVFQGAAPSASSSSSASNDAETLTVYCAAGVRPPIEAAAKQYEQEYGVSIRLEYGGSNTLLGRIGLADHGDLFLAAEQYYIDLARERGLAAESLPLAVQEIVIATARGNPHGIDSLESLLEDDLRIGLANPDAAAAGKASREILEKAGLWDELRQAVEKRGVFTPTVSDLANSVKLGAVDAALLWDATADQYPELDSVPIEGVEQSPEQITVAVLTSTEQPTQALHFARYLAAPDRGLAHFKKAGYATVDGDAWTDRPNLTLYLGGVLRPAVEQTIAEFAAREGVDVNTVYNGCGILVGQIKTGALPDAYFACDRSFMTSVGDVFLDPIDVSRTRMVIAVPKGDPRAIHSLDDLTQADLKLGVCNAEQSALGALTRDLLRRMNLYERIEPNIVAQVPTADMLIAQLRLGALDAAIVYEANYRQAAEQLAMVEIPEATAVAVQPWAIAKKSPHQQLSARLAEALEGAGSRERFLANGFDWLGAAAVPAADKHGAGEDVESP